MFKMSVLSNLVSLGVTEGLITVCILILAVAIFIHRKYYIYSDRFMDLASKIPGPTWYPFIGSGYLFGTNPKDILQNVTDIVTKNDSVVFKVWMGPFLVVVVTEPKDIINILSNKNLLTKPVFYDLIASVIGNGILLSSGEYWKKHRKALRPTFSNQILESYVSVFNAKMKILTDVLRPQVEKHHIDIFPYFLNCVNDISYETLLTTDQNQQTILKAGEKATFPVAIHSGSSILLCRLFKPWLYGDFLFNMLPISKELNSYKSYCYEEIRQVVYRKKKLMISSSNKKELTLEEDGLDKKSKPGFLDYVLEHVMNKALTEEEVITETITMMVAGIDTTLSTLGFLLSILSRRFDIQEKIIEEMIQVFGTLEYKPVTSQDVLKFTYLDRVIKETLRIIPITPIIARQVTEEINLPTGYTLPNGCSVVIPFFLLHRDPKLYPNPHVFDPDNFLPERIAARPASSYCPFSAGPRECIGKKYSDLLLRIGTLTVLREFWITPTDVKLVLEGQLVLNSIGGILVGLKKRSPKRPHVHGIEKMSKLLETNIEYLNVHFKDSYI